MTSRQGVEIPFINFENIEEVRAELAEGGVKPGVCGPRVRTVTACQGNAVCPSGCIDSYDFKTLVELKLKKSIEQCKMTRQWNHDMKMMHAFINIIMVLMFIVCIIIRFY